MGLKVVGSVSEIWLKNHHLHLLSFILQLLKACCMTTGKAFSFPMLRLLLSNTVFLFLLGSSHLCAEPGNLLNRLTTLVDLFLN